METKLSNQRIFDVISNDKVFFRYYLNDYFYRLLINSQIDKEYLISLFIDFNAEKGKNLFPVNIIEFADKINKLFNKEGLRNYDFNDIKDPLYVPVKHSLVFQKFYSLLDSYRTLWSELEALERESFLHIHLMRIYPFIHNNELINLLILNSNLINNYYPPILITVNERSDYLSSITSGDALKFKNILTKKIDEEFNYLVNLYKKHYLFPDNISIEEIIIKKTNY